MRCTIEGIGRRKHLRAYYCSFTDHLISKVKYDSFVANRKYYSSPHRKFILQIRTGNLFTKT